MYFKTLEETIGNTPLLEIPSGNASNKILIKLEGNNPGGSVKDRPAIRMINDAEKNGLITKGDTLIEATNGNTGIALSMTASIKGYKMINIMPEILVPSSGWTPIIWISGFLDFRNIDTPVIVPVVPIAETKCVIFPPVCSHISGPVVS